MRQTNTFLDNLIPLRARLNHWQLAGWSPTRIAENGLGCRLLADVAVPMADGTKLSADVYTPEQAGRYPVIVQFAAYNRDLHTTGLPKGTNEIGSPRLITDRGYVQVIVTARGIGRSEGRLQPWLCEAEIDDFVACIEWAGEQPWSDGQVCLFGTSYYGMNQPAVATRRPKPLKAFFANEICTDYRRHLFRYGGVFNADFFSLWCGANFTPAEIRRYVPPWRRALLSHLLNRPWLWDRILKRRIDAVMRRSFKSRRIDPEVMRWYVALLANNPEGVTPPLPEGYSAELGRIDVPFVVVQNRGLIALHQFGAYDLFEHAGTSRNRKWLIIGPAEYELPVLSWQLEALAFFDYVIKGVENGYDRQPRVRYWRDGADGWASADEFPPADAKLLRLYPDPDTRALSSTVPRPATATWLSIPRGIAVLPGIDAIEPEVLRYRFTAPADLDLVGPVTVNLRYACSEIDSYLVARLDRIDARGMRRCLSMGHLRPATRRVDAARSSRCEIAIDLQRPLPLAPNEPVVLRFSLTPAAAVLRAGETLELAVASRTDHLLEGVAPSDGYIVPDMAVPPYFARNTIFAGEESYLELWWRS